MSVILPVALIGLSALIWRMDSLPFRASATTPARTAKNTSIPKPRRIFAAGVVEGTNRQVPLRFEIAGRLRDLHAVEGTHVRKRDPLAQLEDSVLKQSLVEALSRLALAKGERERLVNGSSAEARKLARADAQVASVRVDLAKAEFTRAAKAFEQGALTSQEFEKYEFQLKTARAQWARDLARVAEVEARARDDEIRIADAKILIALAAVDQARVRLAKSVLRAPADGIVLRVDAEPGELTGPDATRPVFTFVDDALIHVRAYVEELDALRLQIGQTAEVVADGLPGKRFAGKIVWVSPSMHPKTVLHRKPGEHLDVKVREVRILIDKPERLVFGLPVEVLIQPTNDRTLPAATAEGRRREAPPAKPAASRGTTLQHSIGEAP